MGHLGRDNEEIEMVNREHRRVLKKCDIGRDKVSMFIKRAATITLLKSGITEEDTLRGLG